MIQNPILPGFCPDPSIIRVGEDYYIANSSFEWWPGVKIYHSKDLKHYEQLPSPLNRMSQLNMVGEGDSCGVWAPDISWDGEYFWLIYTDVKTRTGGLFNTHNYLVKSKDIRGGWSEPVYLNSSGFDPSVFHDTDGKMYIVNMINNFKGILVQEYDPEKECLVGEAKNVFPGTGRGYTEGPHIYHIGEYYYLMIAEGGTDQHHCVAVARSKELFESFENNPDNPVMTHRMMGSYAAITNVGHADLVETQNGNWYAVMLASRNIDGKHKNLGRETYICPVVWEDGWPLFSPKTGHLEFEYEGSGLPDTRYEHQIKRYEFEEKEFEQEWTWWGTPYELFFERKDSKLNIKCVAQKLIEELKPASFDFQSPRGRENFAPFIALRETEFNFSVACCMRFKPITQESAGLAIVQQMNNQYHFEWIQEEGTEYLQLVRYFAEFDSRPYLPGFSSKTKCETIAKVPYDKEKVVLKLKGKGKDYTFYYGESEAELKEFAKGDSTKISTEQIGCMTGTMIGMYATGNGKNVDNQATFEWFEMI